MLKKCTIVILSLICIWQLVVFGFKLPDYLLPGPIDVFKCLFVNFQLLATEAWVTMLETFIGLLLGVVLGMICALGMTYFKIIKYWMMPILILSQAIRTFVFAPILIIWFGYGISSKVAITVFSLFFPVAASFFDGLTRTNKGWLELASTMQCSEWRNLWFIKFPAALPSLASGIRVAVAWAPMAAVIGEWIGSNSGLGFLMINANVRMDINLMFATLIVLVAFSLLLYFSVDMLLKKLITW
jgi:putative hydroxymethylpyrimidine transport system permease protein